MKQVDYIIVGFGLAGLAMAKTLEKNKKSFIVIDNGKPISSLVAGGFVSPVILKRFTPVWQAEEQVNYCYEFFGYFEKEFDSSFIERFPIYRRFASVEEQNNWMIATDKSLLSPFLSSKLINEQIKGVDAPFGFGEVMQSGRILVAETIEAYKKKLLTNEQYMNLQFDYNALKITDNTIQYEGIAAKQLIFAEGYAVNSNPYFKHLPLDGTKGELIVINAPELELKVQLKAGVIILPIGDGNFFVAATFNWKDKTNTITEAGKKELMDKLDKILTVPYTVIAQKAGVRPTVKDRRPLVGKHPKHKNIYVLNGLGTRGVMIGPAMAKSLYNYIENNIALDEMVDCKRYDKLL
jgi:hypothetical protein